MHSALVWGSSVKHNPQKVGKEHVLNDEDVVQIVKKLVNLLSQYKSCMGVCMVVHYHTGSCVQCCLSMAFREY